MLCFGNAVHPRHCNVVTAATLADPRLHLSDHLGDLDRGNTNTQYSEPQRHLSFHRMRVVLFSIGPDLAVRDTIAIANKNLDRTTFDRPVRSTQVRRGLCRPKREGE